MTRFGAYKWILMRRHVGLVRVEWATLPRNAGGSSISWPKRSKKPQRRTSSRCSRSIQRGQGQPGDDSVRHLDRVGPRGAGRPGSCCAAD